MSRISSSTRTRLHGKGSIWTILTDNINRQYFGKADLTSIVYKMPFDITLQERNLWFENLSLHGCWNHQLLQHKVWLTHKWHNSMACIHQIPTSASGFGVPPVPAKVSPEHTPEAAECSCLWCFIHPQLTNHSCPAWHKLLSRAPGV